MASALAAFARPRGSHGCVRLVREARARACARPSRRQRALSSLPAAAQSEGVTSEGERVCGMVILHRHGERAPMVNFWHTLGTGECTPKRRGRGAVDWSQPRGPRDAHIHAHACITLNPRPHEPSGVQPQEPPALEEQQRWLGRLPTPEQLAELETLFPIQSAAVKTPRVSA